MPSARTSNRGFDLNCRFAVNGIQNASRSPFERAGLIWAFMAASLSFGNRRAVQMINKIDTELNYCCIRPPSVYYNRHYELERGCPFESRAADVRAVAA